MATYMLLIVVLFLLSSFAELYTLKDAPAITQKAPEGVGSTKTRPKKCIGDNDPNIIDPSPDCPDPDSNAEIDETKYEGDIDLGKKSKNAVISSRRKWPKHSDGNVYVPYTIESTLSSSAQLAVQQAIEAYNDYTCIRFVPYSNQNDYISLFSGQGCFSALGKTGGKQQVSLGRGCEFKGTAAHELMHAIGFLHEQARPDRDDFVDIQWQNIQRGMESQFQKGDSNQYTTQGIDYDYSSVMHYEATAFSANGQPTIVPKQAGVQLGQRRGFSKLDVEKINTLYECKGNGEETPSTDSPNTGCSDELPGDMCEKKKEKICSSRKSKYCKKTCGLCTSTTSPQPEPKCPEPSPEPKPGPGPQPGPFPGPRPGPFPGPQPGPFPGPRPNPGPFPGPHPGPFPGPHPGPFPGPHPGPFPGPHPGPFPGPHPGPFPGPHPGPFSGPHPGPFPRPNPGPGPFPRPGRPFF